MKDNTFMIQQGTHALTVMVRSRLFEEKLDNLFAEGHLHGTTHLSSGQEAVQVGVALALSDGDWIVPTHRCHGHTIARGASPYAMFSEMFGSVHGLSKGLGGSMHMTDLAHGNPGGSAVVGSGVALATGAALAMKRLGQKNVTVAFFGDGASSRGVIHETMNLASLWKLPVIFLCENNQYGMSAPVASAVSAPSIASRGAAYGIPSCTIDGNDVSDVFHAVRDAASRARSGEGPVLIEAVTYRIAGHSRNDRRRYRSREEEALWAEQDPILRLRDELIALERFDMDEWTVLMDRERKMVDDAAEKAEADAHDVLPVEEAQAMVFAPPSGKKWPDIELSHVTTYREALREALSRCMKACPEMFLMGEDIGLYGGCFKVTNGLWDSHDHDRILETPVSEEGFTGVAAGAAMFGLRPVVEIMYGDFMTLASDPVINHAAKSYFMSGGQLPCPLVIRTPVGSGSGHGAQHTQSLEAMFVNIPGLKVVAPATVKDACVLLSSSIADNGPVVFLEHRMLYDMEGEVSQGRMVEPLGKAAVRRPGSDITLVSYSRAVHTCLEAATRLADEGIEAEVIDLRTLVPLDEDAIRASVRRTRRALVVHDAPLHGGYGGEIVACIAGDLDTFMHLAAPVERLCGLDMPVPFSPGLEAAIIPSVEKIVEKARSMVEWHLTKQHLAEHHPTR
ncbi:alpha-ketoacid dehydrogenase subunit alpha/beta [Parasphaerochaeta coccoides]|uniref:Pyruvate dehydrogenase (Acetyl-transferring) n=1 Tax=Parasphaerochaeta coccoides (strain ATCC BAA-1237 / DSM 17374 / SPN1) TaxID=760011 RepID=F4GM25_PARC1|nr:dehydrogenase E1 component subunit alpha/beta [Parasphaerochaeta coccoides]AEC02500.1 Pyruvate dehydrogenase (acetyl-transferring) [Parasphaerochaeta coccoides DSM 17374]